jgi:hypothetical protein
MKKILHLLSIAAVFAFVCSSVAQAGHPLIQNGWLKSVTATSLTILLPPTGNSEATFTFAPNVKIDFTGADGSVADLQRIATTMGKTRILVNLRRDKPESTTVVLVGIKAPKPALPAPAAPPADGSQPAHGAPLAPDAAGSSAE